MKAKAKAQWVPSAATDGYVHLIITPHIRPFRALCGVSWMAYGSSNLQHVKCPDCLLQAQAEAEVHSKDAP